MDLLEAGSAAVSRAGIRLYHDGQGPQADGALHIQIDSPGDPRVVTQSAVERAVACARGVIDLAMSDPRFAQLMAAYPAVWEFIDDDYSGYIPVGCRNSGPFAGLRVRAAWVGTVTFL